MPSRPGPGLRQGDIVAAARRATINSVTDAVVEAVGNGLSNIANSLVNGFVQMRQAITQSNYSALQNMYQELGILGQRSMLSSYGQLVTRQEGAASKTHYRAGRGRLAGGILKNALGRDDFFKATPKGLVWGNITMLDGAAAHWHRIAFGAGSRGSGETKEFEINFNGLTHAVIGITEPASPGFSLPPGIWRDLEGGTTVSAGFNIPGTDAFYPSSQLNSKYSIAKRGGVVVVRPNLAAKQNGVAARGRPSGQRPTQGIRGKPFFEAGLKRIAAELPDQLDLFVENTFGDWKKAFRAGFKPSSDIFIQTKDTIRIDRIQIS